MLAFFANLLEVNIGHGKCAKAADNPLISNFVIVIFSFLMLSNLNFKHNSLCILLTDTSLYYAQYFVNIMQS